MTRRTKVRAAVTAILIALFAGACADMGEKQTIGTVFGAAVGGLLGAQFGSGTGQLAATGAGVLIGALIGSDLGRTMDEVDRMKANEAVEKAHSTPIGETVRWSNPDSGNSGTVRPLREGTASSGEVCREFEQTITVNGQTEKATGVACRVSDGTWRIVD